MLLVALMMPAASFAEKEYIRTDGYGKTEEQAKFNAFVKAIEYKLGVMVLSDRETKKLEQTKNDIYAYSAGYVADYKIISSNTTDEGVYVTVDVKVNSSKIKNRILVDNSKPAEINGTVAGASFSTYSNTKSQADSLIKKVLLNYPKNAYKTIVTSTKVKTNVDRRFAISVDFTISLNNDFVDNLEETLATVEQTRGKYSGKVTIDKEAFTAIFDSRKHYYIEDIATLEMMYDNLAIRNTRVKISFEDGEKSLYSVCRAVETFVKLDSNNITFFKGKKSYYSTEIADADLVKVIDDVTNVQLSVVTAKECVK